MIAALAFFRFAHFLAAMQVFGMSACLCAFAPVRLRLALTPLAHRLALIASLVALVTAIGWLALEAASMVDDVRAALDPEAIGAVLADTAFGNVWLAHIGLAAGLIAVIAWPGRARWGATALASGALLASLGLIGHAAMQSGVEGVLHRVNHAAHLLTTGAWLGGLAFFALCLEAYQRDDLRRDAVQAMAGFSFWGQLVVAAVILTGVANVALTSHDIPLPPTTPYRALLIAKLGIVAIMIALALFNRFVLAPRLKQDAEALSTLRGTCAAEIGLGSLAVALVSVLALFDPA